MAERLREFLDHLPPRKRAELARITEILFEEFERTRERATIPTKREARIL